MNRRIVTAILAAIFVLLGSACSNPESAGSRTPAGQDEPLIGLFRLTPARWTGRHRVRHLVPDGVTRRHTRVRPGHAQR